MSEEIIPAWKRPYWVVEEIEDTGLFTEVSIAQILVKHGYAPSMRAARRLMEQPIFWLDDMYDPTERLHLGFNAEGKIAVEFVSDGCDIFDRLRD